MGIKSFRRRLSHSVCVLALLCLIVALLKPGSRERKVGTEEEKEKKGGGLGLEGRAPRQRDLCAGTASRGLCPALSGLGG